MENQKDIQKTDNLSNFLSQNVRVNPFGQNISGDRMYRRAERIVAALYVLTNHISPEEPAWMRTREKAISLLEDILLLAHEMRAPSSPQAIAIQMRIRELASLVRMLSIAGHISPQNTEAVVGALDELANFLTVSQRSVFSESVFFSKEDLLADSYSVQETKKIIKNHSGALREKEKNQGSQIKDKKDIYRTHKDESKKELNQRSLLILDILKAQGVVGIKDIAANLPEYSEKTIQRELVQLSDKGLVKRQGFRRWSKYTIVEG